MTSARTLLGVFVAVCLLASAGCGLSTNDSPEALARDNLPPDLGGTPETMSPVPPGTEGVPVELWFMETSSEPPMLAPLPDTVPRNPTAKIVLETLFQSNDDLGESKLRSAIPAGTRTVRDPSVDDDVLVLDLPESFYNGLVEDEGRYAYGQIVLTMADNFGNDIQAVQFMFDGQEKAVSVGDGAERVNGLVTASDYDSLRAPVA